MILPVREIERFFFNEVSDNNEESRGGKFSNFNARRRPFAMGPYFHIVTHTRKEVEEEKANR